MSIIRRPIFLFAFANDKSKSLRLEEEERQLRQILAPMHDQGRIEFLSLGSTSLDDIYRSFNRFHGDIAFFHYSGHSDENFLHLTDTGARSESLSKIIGMQEGLKLVFLNGCSNKAQVKELFTNGVNTIIATQAPIEDAKALNFSKSFYEAFVGGKNIKDSFDTAASRVQNDAPDLKIQHRTFEKIDKVKEVGLEWGLYTKSDELLTWTIPEPQGVPEDQDFIQEVDLIAPDINKEVVTLAFEGLSEYRDDCKAIWGVYKATPNPAMFNTLQSMMLASYPSSLSIQLRDLFTPNVRSKGRLRLEEINEVYLTLLKFICAISLADLWHIMLSPETYEPLKGFKIKPEYQNCIKEYFEISVTSADTFDYGWLLETIKRIFDDNGKKPFIAESEKFLKSFSDFDEVHSAYSFMEKELRRRLQAKNIPTSEVEDLCLDTEKQLGVLLRACGFLGAYQLVTVKDISVRLPNRVPLAHFIHESAILTGDNYGIREDVAVEKNSYTNSNSVLITRDINEDDGQLNLSPFVIDENAFKLRSEKLPKIFFFKGWGENESIHYELAETLKEQIEIKKEPDLKTYKKAIGNIRDQFTWFMKDLSLS